MKNFLQVNRALVAEKNYLLFNQSFGTVGSPNQTDETLTRENRIGLKSYLRRTLVLLFAVLTLSIANVGVVWGATHTVTPNIGGTQYEIYNIYSNSSAYAFFSNQTTIRSAYSSWVSGQLSNKSDGGATAFSGWLSTSSGKPGYGKGMVNNSKTVTMTVTNCIEVAFVSKSGGSRTSNLSVKLNGVEVGSVATNGNTYAAVTYGTALDASKTYTITLSGSTSDNCEVDQIRFKAPAVCSAALGGTTSNPSATVGESAGTISCTVNNGAAKTATSYQWYKNTSKSTSGATSISGATSSTYSPNEASAGTYYYYCTVQTAQITTDGADAARITSGISDAFVFTAAPAGSGWGIAGSMNSWTAATNEMTGSGTVSTTISLSANTQYEFKVVDISSDTWYGNGGTIKGGITDWLFETSKGNTYLRTSCAGDYTFTFNTSTKNLSITYPESHKVFFNKDGASWSNIYAYCYNDGDWNIGWPGIEITSNTEDHCGTEYYAYTNGYTYIIFNNGSGGVGNQTGNITVAGYEGNHAVGAAATGWSAYTTYTITYAANGGGSSMSSETGICPNGSQTLTSNAFTAPSGCASFSHWTANVAVTANGNAVAAGGAIADGATLSNINSDIALTAVWKLSAPTITKTPLYNTFTVSGSMAGSSYKYSTDGTTPTNAYSSAVAFDAAITAKAIATKSGYADSDVASLECSYINCSISSCGNATLTYTINGSTSVANTAANLVSTTDVDPDDTPALDVPAASSAVTLSTMGFDGENGKAVAKSNGCYTTSLIMSSKLSVHNGSSFNTSHYLQFAFTVKEGYTFTPCDIQFVVQPTSYSTDFRWEITDGSETYGYGVANGVGTGSDAGATVLTGITSPSAMGAGTYYIRLYPKFQNDGKTNYFRIADNVILKGTTAAAACTAPTTVNVTATVNEVSGFWFYPDDDVVLTAAPTGSPAGSPITYQWKKNGSNVGTNSATLTINDAVASDAGKYTCTISYGACSTTSAEFSLKCMQFYLKNSGGSDISNHALIKEDATHASLTLELTGGTTYKFRVTDGCNDWYGNTGEMTSSSCTDWHMEHDADCRITTNSTTGDYTFLFDFTDGILGNQMKVSVVYPGGDQASGKTIYWDNSVLNWAAGNQWYRIGTKTGNTKTQMTLVPGTANLYKVTTGEYNGFQNWHIANNQGEGTGNVFWTKDSDPATNEEITAAMAYDGVAVTSVVTVTPTNSHATGETSDNDNCEFYTHTTVSGMKTDRVTITEPSNGTISVAYTDVAGASQSFTSGNRDLAHTVIITPTATPATGYNLGSLTVNEAEHTSGNTYTVTANTTIAATFTAKTYNITLDRNGASSGSESVTMTYNSSSHTAITAPVKAGYTFDGWYDTETDNNGSGNLVMNASGVLQENVTGFTGAGGIWTKDATCTLYAKWTAAPAPAGDCEDLFAGTATSTTVFTATTGSATTALQTGASFSKGGYSYCVKPNSSNAIVATPKDGSSFAAGDSLIFVVYNPHDGEKTMGFTTASGTTSASVAVGNLHVFRRKLVAADISAGKVTFNRQSSDDRWVAITIKHCDAPSCSTPSAPTATSNGATAATTQVVSWTDGSNDKWDVYVSTSSSTPAAGVTPTASGLTAKTYTFTGLTASTAYYWWVRSVCDASHKSAWVAGSSFTTEAGGEAPIPALISYYLQTPNNKTTPASLSTDSIITTPARLKGDTLKSFVPVSLGSSLDITKAGKGDGGTWSAGIGTTPADSATAVVDAYAAKLAFDVHDDYELNISSITLKVLSVTNGNQIYRVKVSDGEHTVYGRVAPDQNTESSVVFGSFAGIKFSGTVTLTLWVWSNAAAEYRLKSPIQIDGTLTRKVTACTMPTQTFSTGAYTLGDAALSLSTLFSSNSSGTVTYSVVSAGGTSATIVGSSFTASSTGTATIRATQAADGVGNYCAKSIETTITVSGTCTPQSLSKVSATQGTSGTVTGYNDGQYAGDAVVNLYNKSPESASLPGVGTVNGYKMGDDGTSIVFATLKGTSFQVDDKVRIGITKKNDNRTVDASKDILTIYYGTSKTDVAALHTITGVTGAGFYEYTLTSADVTAIGSKKGIGLFRESDNGENPYVYSVEIIGCREWTVCTAPNAVAAGSETAEGATFTVTDAAETGSYEFYWNTTGDAPTAETAALTTGSALTKSITGLTASTTYYYWVRSNCGGVTKSAWVAGTPASFSTSAAASTYSVTYNGNGKTGGDVPTDATAYEAGDVVTVLGNTGSLVKTGQTFLGWSTSSTASTGTFYPAGYKFTMPASAVTLYAVWGSTGATCVTLTNFATSSSTSSVPDGQSRYFYGYPNSSMSDEDRILITTDGNSDCRGQSEGTIMRLNYGKKIRIYSSSSTTTYSGITAISFKWRFYSTGNGGKTEETSSYTVKVVGGSTTTVANAVSITGKSNDDYRTVNITGLSSLNGYVEITAGGSSSNHHLYLDDIQICYGSGVSSGYTVSFNMKDHGSAIADIENIPSGSKIGAPIPEPTATDWDFGGWYKETGCTNAWNFESDQVTSNTTLYAKWGNCAPTITTHPVAANYNQNGVASAMTVEAATNGGGELHYQWWVKENDLAEEDGSAIPGETSTSFTPSTELLGTSYYYCVVSNDCGNVKTNTAAVTIRDTKPDPTAVWTVAEPTHGGKGFTFSVIAKNDDGTELWDGTLTEEMLSVSSEAVLGTVTVNNETKTISGTYGVKASATSPVTFYLLLPATETFAAKRLDYDRTFTACVGGDGSTHDIRVLKANKNITFGGGTVYGWDNPGEGFLTASTGGTVSTAKAGTKMESVFDSVYNTNKTAFWVMPYAAGIKKIKVYGDVRVKELEVSNVRKVKAFTSGKDANNIAFSAAYEGGGDNVATTGYHWFEIILEDALDANDIIYFTVSKNFQISGVRVTEAGSGGSLNTSLAWSNSQSDGATVNKNEGDADFSITATRGGTYADNSNASLGAISYNSSKPEVATVDAATGKIHIVAAGTTVIKATLAASGCYKKAEITYSLVVAEYVCAEAAGTVSIKSEPDCAHKVLTVTYFEEGATTFQWYKDGEVIGGATSQDYTATTSGTYSVSTEKTCAVMSANSITLTFDAATATKIVDSWYIKNGRRTPDIALVQTKNATGFTVTSSSDPVTEIGGCSFELKDDGIIYLHGTKTNGDAPSDMTPGDMTITITATACANAAPLDINLHIQAETAKPSVAFVVDGTLRKDGGSATSVSEAKTSDRPIWKYLANSFALTGCNAYWSVDSKELRQYYSQFDAILITDDPNTSTSGTGGVSYVKAFGTMVDVRPVLTMEAYVGKFKDGGWHVYDATPTSPNPRQVEMKLECKNHDIFKGLNPASSDNVRTTTDEYGNEYWHVIMVDTTLSPYHNTKSDYEALPALQGFDKTKFSNMLGVGTIFGEKLQAGVERQEEPAARMMILGIQNNAMAALTTEGKLVVKNALEYLLKTNMEDVNDCANYFTNADGDGQWSNGANWTRGEVPDFETRARILKPVTIGDGTTAIAARVDIAASGESKHLGESCTGSITINPQGLLKVGGKVTRAKAPYFGIDDLQPTQPEDLYLTTNPSNQSALIFDNSEGNTQAVVQVYSKAHKDGDNRYWQYLTSPLTQAPVTEFFYGIGTYTFKYDEAQNGWVRYNLGTTFEAFDAIGLTQNETKNFVFYGPLASTEDRELNLTNVHNGENMFGNSWTAPLQLTQFDDDDFEGEIEKTFYVYNTGFDAEEGTGAHTDASNTAGEWQSIPLSSLDVLTGLGAWAGLKVVPAYQAFYVKCTSAGTITLNYDKHVRPATHDVNEGLRAPKRAMSVKMDVLGMRISVENTSRRSSIYLLEDEDFTEGFDNGWDGDYFSGDANVSRFYSVSPLGRMAVSALPNLDGTALGFEPASMNEEYTFTFHCNEDKYYLNDLKMETSTPIRTGESYTFMSEEGDGANRFYISATPFASPQITTGSENLDAAAPKVQKIIYNDKLYIIRGGKVYSADGQVVK